MAGAEAGRAVVARAGELIVVGERARAADLCARTHAAVQALVNEARAICDGRARGALDSRRAPSASPAAKLA